MEISNKTLAILLVVAIVLAVGGALFSLGRTGITGLGSGTGYVNVTVSQDTTINIVGADIDFGSGYIEGTNETAQLISNGTTINWSGAGATSTITVHNDGNVNLTVTASAERNSTSFFLNQTGTKEYKYKTQNNESGSAQSLVTTLTDLNTSTQTICTHLSSVSNANTIDFVASLQFGTTIQGTFTDTLTFSSSAT